MFYGLKFIGWSFGYFMDIWRSEGDEGTELETLVVLLISNQLKSFVENFI